MIIFWIKNTNFRRLKKDAVYLPLTKEITLTTKDERDIAKELERIMNDIRNNQDGSLYFDGKEIDEISLSLLADAMETALRQVKLVNKEKYNPNKNKK